MIKCDLIEDASTKEAPQSPGCEHFPLSPGQQRVWFLQQREWFVSGFNPASDSYVFSIAVRIVGRLDALALKHAFHDLSQRHASLRTAFPTLDGEPRQVIVDELDPAAPLLSFANAETLDRPISLQQLAHRESRHVKLRFETPPLLRCRIVPSGEQEWLLVLRAHHIIWDAWSWDVMWRDLSVIYSAIRRGAAVKLEPLPIQFSDHACRQDRLLESEEWEAQRAYWLRKFAGEPSIINLPRNHDGPLGRENRGKTLEFSIDPGLVKSLRRLALKTRSSLFILLLTAFKVLLSRYSGQDDVVVGSPFTGRTRPDTRDLIGYFTNILALRTGLSGNPEVSDLIDRVRDTVLEAYANQDYTFERLVADKNPRCEAGEIPIFNVMFMFKNISLTGTELPGANVEIVDFYRKRHKFDLTLLVSDATDELGCKLVYNDELFEEPGVQRMVGHFRTLLRGIAAGAPGRLSGLVMISPEERHTLLVEFNIVPPPAAAAALADLIESSEALGPEAMAVRPGREPTHPLLPAAPIVVSRGAEIGRPPAKHRAYVLDQWLEPVPVEVPGELYVGEPARAPHHLDQPGLTAERVVPDPYGVEPGSIMHRTGKRARWRPDGSLELLGTERRAPIADRSPRPSRYTPPRSPLQAEVAAIWAEILRVPRVGLHDNFFELGGHSLAALQLLNRVHEAFGPGLTIRTIFDSPRLAEFAAAVELKKRPPCDARGPLMTAHETSRNEPMHATAIEPAYHQGPVPLSWAQESIWFLDQIMPGQPTFNDISAAFHVTGPLDLLALEQALNEIMRRHESLRTTFVAIDGTLQQVISNDFHLALTLVDLSAQPPGQRDAEVKRLAMQQTRQPFDLTHGPLGRVSVLRRDQGDHVVLLTIHHIVFDVWSLGVAAGELAKLYRAVQRGLPCPLPDPPIQYSDFVYWQRGQVESDRWAPRIDDFIRTLSGVPALDLPTDHPRPPIRSSRGAQKPLVISRALSDAVRATSRSAGVTPFVTLLAAFQVVLGRWSGQDDFAIGSPFANRTRPETEHMIGYFINMLALRADLSGDPTVRELLLRTREVVLHAIENQDIPLEVVVRSLRSPVDASRSPVFQVMFAFQNFALPEFGPLDVTITPLDLDEGTDTSKFDVSLGFNDTPDAFIGKLEYNTDLFEPETIDRLIEQFDCILRSIVADPDLRLSRLLLLPPDEQQRLIELGTGPRRDYPVHRPIDQLFQKIAAAHPERTAAVHNDTKITYAGLDKRANQIARHLLRRGVESGAIVGILDHRGIDALASMLGVLKAGGAFLPLDPGYPTERVAYMLADSKVPVLISRTDLINELPQGSFDGHRVLLDDPELDREPTSPPERVAPATALAYLLYTSGSTGPPKGAMVRHDGAVNHIFAEFELLGIHAFTAFLQTAPSSSDISVWQYLAPLLIGGRTVIADHETVCDPAALLLTIRKQRITLIELVPAVMKELLDHAAQLTPQERALPDLEWAMVTGEAATPALVNQWLNTYPGIRLVNAYGPTEASDDICQMVLDHPLESDGHAVPIGRPLPNLTLYVLDRNLSLVPRGAVGEICVAGIGVGEGYWNNPEKTQASFVLNPHNSGGGRADLLYRTGDLGRWLPDGTLECLERLDRQVKIRGFRVEPGEVEEALTAHPAVNQATVLARDDGQGGRRLVAYVVPAPGIVPDAVDLRRYLATRLPRYMVPASFVTLEALPLTPNGKLDRHALPPPERHVDGYRAPRTHEEELLCGAFANILGLSRVSIDDDFFELGGHSLLVVRLSSEIAKSFNQSCPITVIYQHPNVEQLAAVLRRGAWTGQAAPHQEHTVHDADRTPPFFCLSHATLLASHLAELPVHSLGVWVDDVRDSHSIEEIAAVNLERLRRQQKQGPYRLSGFCGMALVAFEMARRLDQQGQEVSLLALIEPPPVGPILRARSFRTRHYASRVLFHLNHLSRSHPKSWLNYCRVRVSTIRRRFVARSMEITNRPDKLDLVSRMERHIRAYKPGKYPGPVVLVVSRERVAESAGETDFGWRAVTGGTLDVRTVPGDHSTIFDDRNLRILARELTAALDSSSQCGPL